MSISSAKLCSEGLVPNEQQAERFSRRHCLSQTAECGTTTSGKRLFAHLLDGNCWVSEIGVISQKMADLRDGINAEGRKHGRVPPPLVKKPYVLARKAVTPPFRDNGDLVTLGLQRQSPLRVTRTVRPVSTREDPSVKCERKRHVMEAESQSHPTRSGRRSATPPPRDYDIITGVWFGKCKSPPHCRPTHVRFGSPFHNAHKSTIGDIISWT